MMPNFHDLQSVWTSFLLRTFCFCFSYTILDLDCSILLSGISRACDQPPNSARWQSSHISFCYFVAQTAAVVFLHVFYRKVRFQSPCILLARRNPIFPAGHFLSHLCCLARSLPLDLWFCKSSFSVLPRFP